MELTDCYTNVSPDDYIITKVYDFLWERQLFITRLFNLNAETKGKWLNERLLGYCSLSGKAMHLQWVFPGRCPFFSHHNASRGRISEISEYKYKYLLKTSIK